MKMEKTNKKTYVVEIKRTEVLRFTVEANSPEQAENDVDALVANSSLLLKPEPEDVSYSRAGVIGVVNAVITEG